MMTSKGITAISSAMALSLMGTGSIATRVFIGFLGDYTRRYRIYILIIAMILCGCLTVVCVRFTLFWQFWIYGVLFGACTGKSTVADPEGVQGVRFFKYSMKMK